MAARGLRASARIAAALALVAACCLGPQSAQAQGWTSDGEDSGAYVSAFAQAGGTGFGLLCAVRSLGRVSPLVTEEHEMQVTAPYTLRLEMSPRLVPYTQSGVRSDLVLWIDGTGYRLPPARYSDFYGGWDVALAMDDPMIVALRGARDLVLAVGQGQAWRLPTDNVGPALGDAIRICGNGAAALGHPTPPALAALLHAAPGLSPGPVAGLAPHTGAGGGASGTAVPGGIDARATNQIVQVCNGPAITGAAAILRADLDRDGREDAVVDLHHVTCRTGLPRPYCGASNCSIFILLSREAAPREQLAQGARLARGSDGATYLQLHAGLGTCQARRGSTANCWFTWGWTGRDFAPID